MTNLLAFLCVFVSSRHSFKTLFLPLLLLVTSSIQAQDLDFTRRMIDSLCSPALQGRGYVNGGDKKAADFLVKQLRTTNAEPIENSYYQYFNIDINTFPGKVQLGFDQTVLLAGTDFMIGSSSPSIDGSYKALWLTKESFKKPADFAAFAKKNLKSTILILDTGFIETDIQQLYSAKAIIFAQSTRPTFDVSDGRDVMPYASAYVSREKIPQGCKKVSFEVESLYQKDYQTQNVVAVIKGTQHPDSFLVYTAHYDHLGRMGAETYFPGAHDNASGCAMLLDLANYYSLPENQPEYSVAFLFFSAEEVGLLGSKYFTEHPLIPLSNIKFLLNLDMVSTGSEGIKVVNGAVLKDQFELLSAVNKQDSLLKTVSPRGEAPNSDHYWFYKKGVPSFFIYTLGPEWKEYHTPDDIPTGLPMTEYEDLFKLATKFMEQLTIDN